MKGNLQITQHTAIITNITNEKGEFRIIPHDLKKDDIYISFSMPDEKILFEKLQYKKASYYNLIRIIESTNPQRVVPPCPHFTICGGCAFQHMNNKFYENHKMRKLSAVLIEEQGKIEKIIVIPKGLRRKANFEGLKKDNKVFLGFHRHNSRQIVNIEICKIIRSEISNLLAPLKELLNSILENFQKAEFFIVLAENGLDVGLEIQNVKQFPQNHTETVKWFSKNHNITRFTFKHGNKFEVLYQNASEIQPFLQFSNFSININPWSFMQTSKEAEHSMINILQNIIDKLSKKDKMIDLFSGRGTYTLSLIHNFKYVKAVEISVESLTELSNIARKNELFIETDERDLFTNPVNSLELNSFDLAIINPPRAGAELQSIELSNSQIENIIYVSCNPETFTRDLNILKKKYEVKLIQPIDQFIWSTHLEIIVWLQSI